jgi:hypothetical protein
MVFCHVISQTVSCLLSLFCKAHVHRSNNCFSPKSTGKSLAFSMHRAVPTTIAFLH